VSTELLVRGVAEAARLEGAQGLAAAQLWADTSGKVLGLLSNGVQGLTALQGFSAPLDRDIVAFTQASNALVNRAAQLGVAFDKDFVKAADTWSGAAGKALDTLGKGVEGLRGLQDFSGPTDADVVAFVQATNRLIN